MTRHTGLRLTTVAAALAATAALPAHADSAEYVGTSCGLVAAATAPVHQLPSTWTGQFHAAWTAVNVTEDGPLGPFGPSPDPMPSVTTVYCWVQVNTPIPDLGGHLSAGRVCSTTFIGSGALACGTQFEAEPTDNLYVCSKVDMRHGPGWTRTWEHDEDSDGQNGNQCVLAASGDGAAVSAPVLAWAVGNRGGPN